MIIIGAKGLAKDLLLILHENGTLSNIKFYDDINADAPDLLFGRFPIIKSAAELKHIFAHETKEYALGIGGTTIRKELNDKIAALGGQLTSIISNKASIGTFEMKIVNGVSILTNSIVSNDVYIGEGTLVNTQVVIGHDVRIGNWCEISPGAKILGRVTLGDYVMIGSNATILPDVKIGSFVSIGAGAVVTKDVPDNVVAVGMPAKIIKYLDKQR